MDNFCTSMSLKLSQAKNKKKHSLSCQNMFNPCILQLEDYQYIFFINSMQKFQYYKGEKSSYNYLWLKFRTDMGNISNR